MYKIIATTDGKNRGKKFLSLETLNINLEGYNMPVMSIVYRDDDVVLSNPNYIIIVKEI